MQRLDAFLRRKHQQLIYALGCSVFVTACASDPKPPAEPELRKLAIEMESNGVKQYGKGDYAKALSLFAEAQRLNQSMDDENASARNRYNQARAALGMGRVDSAIEFAGTIRNTAWAKEVGMLQAQAYLQLGRHSDASAALRQLELQCNAACVHFGSMNVLLARLAVAEGRYEDASLKATLAIPILHERREDREEANAWRIAATAELALNQTQKALPWARNALTLDKAQALPEKIARDWMLIGDIQKKSGTRESKISYQRALEVAQAAQLPALITIATQALKESVP